LDFQLFTYLHYAWRWQLTNLYDGDLNPN
jgi:hypothetical protein